MNREELEAKLKNYEERLKDIAKAIEELRDQVAKVEKPKLRHGDFGYDGTGSCLVAKRNNILEWYGSKSGAGEEATIKDFGRIAVFGNIFDLMKGWDKDFEEFTLDVNHYSINPSDFTHAPVHIAGNWHTEAEAYKFWCDFGQMLMTLKRKKNK